MPIRELIDRAVALLEIVAKKSVKQAAESQLVMEELTRLKGWAYPHLTTEDIVRVVRCAKCRHYKKYKKKDDRKSQPFYACEIDKVKREPDFFCKRGMEK